LLLFLFSSLESQSEIPVKGAVLSHPKITNFERDQNSLNILHIKNNLVHII
jgi:hypothetical protein